MKNLLTLSMLWILVSITLSAQPVRTVQKPVPVSDNVPNVPIIYRNLSSANQQGFVPGSLGQRNDAPLSPMFETVLGTTTYDLQTNASGCNRIYQKSGSIGVTWTHSTLFGPYPDRGTLYSYFDGSNWIPAASAIDTLAWSNIDIGSLSTEYLLGHKNTNPNNTLSLFRRAPSGSGAWTEFPLPAHPSGLPVLWPRMRVGGINGSTVHMIATINGTDSGMEMPLVYSRSQDGGVTWDQQYIYLPMVDPLHYHDMSADAYAIDVKDNVVAIVSASLYTDWILWKSMDNGTTWSRTVIKQFPIPAYDFNTMITDTSGDAIADTINSLDGSLAVLIDNLSNVHSWCGALRVIQETAGSGISFFKTSDGLYYWSESSAGAPTIIASTIDIDGSGIIEVPDGVHGYSLSMSSMPTAGIDASTNIILAYSGVVENTTNGNVDPSMEEAFQNIFVLLSQDNGLTWSAPFRVEPSDFDEMVYPSVPRNLGLSLDLIYMKDGEPGLSVGGTDPAGSNEIVYYDEYFSVIFSGSVVLPAGLFEITGHVFYDSNQNGVDDAGDFNMSIFPVKVMPDAYAAYTDASGNYRLIADSGSKVISPMDTVNWIVTSDSTQYTVNLDSVAISGIDFGVYPANVVYEAEMTLTAGFPRCNSTIDYWLNYKNTGTTVLSGTVKFVMDGQLGLNGVFPAASVISGDTLEWNFTNLMPYEQRMIRVFTSSAGLIVGDTITNCAYVYYNNGAAGAVQEDCQTQPISCSFDPNDKAVKPEGVSAPHYVLLSDTLIYTIRFQNTGNDTAFVVRVRDTLNANLDPSTFRLIASSHPVSVVRNPANNLLFEFENILLPDSNVNEPESHGFIKYSVQPFDGIPVGSEVDNTAYIFFDYNPPVITNTVMNTLVDVIGMNEIPGENYRLHIYPNPANHDVMIVFQNDKNESHEITVSDLTGRVVRTITGITSDRVKIEISGIQSGIYICSVKSQDGISKGIGKLMVK